METSPGEITRLLNEVGNGDRAAQDKLVPLVYQELRRRAAYYMRKERADHTLQPTALAHEAYLRLIGERKVSWQNRSHFYAIAAGAMRHILVDYARKKDAKRRGGAYGTISLEGTLVFSPEKSSQLIALDEALNRLAQRDVRQSRIVELRFFGGLSMEETATAIGISSRHVAREWDHARAWLYGELTKHG